MPAATPARAASLALPATPAPSPPGASDVVIPLVALAALVVIGAGLPAPSRPMIAALAGGIRRPSSVAVAGALVVVIALGGCGDPGKSAAGIVTALDASGGRVTGFTLRTQAGETIVFVVGDLETDGAAFPASHLSEHAVTLQPIAVAYRVEGGRNVAHRMVDAPWALPSP